MNRNQEVKTYRVTGAGGVSFDDLLPALEKPVLISHGVEDRLVLLRHAQYNAKRLKNAKTSFYDKVGHNPFWENPERFNRELKEFADLLK